jgi:hypothetical protein
MPATPGGPMTPRLGSPEAGEREGALVLARPVRSVRFALAITRWCGCRQCGAPLRRGQGDRRYCDNECYNAWRRAQVPPREIACARCGQRVEARTTRMRCDYCARAVKVERQRAWQRAKATDAWRTVPCLWCGEAVRRRIFELGRWPDTYCDRDCAAHGRSWQGHADKIVQMFDRPRRKREKAEAVRERAGQRLSAWSERKWARITDERTSAAAPYLRQVRLDPCAYCGRPSDGLDHIEPRRLTSQGKDPVMREWTNLTAACADCNLRKGVDDLLSFLLIDAQRLGRSWWPRWDRLGGVGQKSAKSTISTNPQLTSRESSRSTGGRGGG